MHKAAYTILAALFALLVAACGGKEADKTQAPADTVSSKPSVKYEIIKKQLVNGSCYLEVLLPGGRCSIDRLKQVGRKLAKEAPGASTIRVFYRLPMAHNVRYLWASQTVLPQGEPTISGITQDEIDIVRENLQSDKQAILGAWINWEIVTSKTLHVLYKENGKYFIVRTTLTTRRGALLRSGQEVKLSQEKDNITKVELLNDPDQYYLLNSNGDMVHCYVLTPEQLAKGAEEDRGIENMREYYLAEDALCFPLEKIK